MKIQILTVLAIACATGTQAASFDDYARVINVQERYSGSTPASGTRTACEPGQQVQSNNYGAGTAIGAIAGGLIGSQVGKGNGRIAGAAVGPATGAMAGHYIEGSDTRQAQHQNCYQTPNGFSHARQRRVTGYSVTYEYAGHTFTEYSNRPPAGDSIRVRVNIAPR